MNKGIKGLNNFFSKIVSDINRMNGQIVGEEIQSSKLRLGKDEKETYVNYAADQYLKKEPITDIPPEVEVTTENVIKELVDRHVKDNLKA